MSWTYAELLTQVGALAGVLRAFGTGVGDRVAVGPLPPFEGVVVTLAVARLGAVVEHADDLAPHVAAATVLVAGTDPASTPATSRSLTVDDSTELSWAMVMRAGRTDPGGLRGRRRRRRARPARRESELAGPRRARRPTTSRSRRAPRCSRWAGSASGRTHAAEGTR